MNRIEILKVEHKAIMDAMMGKTYRTKEEIAECMVLNGRLNQLCKEIQVLTYPDLKGKTCPLCKEKYDGFGNNPAPLKVNGRVCDSCNWGMIIPLRMKQ